VPPVSESFVFWAIAAAMTAVALAFVLPHLLARRATPTRARRVSINVGIYRSALAELAREHAEGRLTDEQHEQAREDFVRRLLADGVDDPVASGPTAPPRGAAIALAIALPVLAFGLYALFGDPAALDGAPTATTVASDGAGSPPVRRDALVRHLARNARDGRAWVLLARMDVDADRFPEAAGGYAKALAVSPKIAADPGIWCEYADALGMAQGGSLLGRPRELVVHALTLDAAHPKALELAGSAAYEQREFAAAAKYWHQLLVQLPEGSQPWRELSTVVARAERQMLVARTGPEASR